MKIKSLSPLFSLGGIFFLININSAQASDCPESKVAFYLKNGFTHEQVVRLCTSSSNSNPAPVTTSRARPPQYTSPSPVNNYEKDQDYFNTVIDSNSASIDKNKLSIERRECAVYGDLDMTQTRDKVCINTRININLKGLQILRATKGVPLLKKQELLVKGNIQREYVSDTTRINTYKMDAVRKQLPNHPKTFNIPVKAGIHPETVANRLKKRI